MEKIKLFMVLLPPWDNVSKEPAEEREHSLMGKDQVEVLTQSSMS